MASMRNLAALVWLLAGSTMIMAQDEVKLTVYNQNRALVNELRTLTFPKGAGRVDFHDVAAQLDPTSVQVQVLNQPGSVSITEQNFEYDLVSGDKLYEKYIDQALKVQTRGGESVSGNLLSVDGGQLVLQESAGNLVAIRSAEIVSTAFPALPDGLRTRPTLVWDVVNQGATERKLEIAYLTQGISWHAEYVGVLDKNDAKMQLNGWVSIDNRSGKTYKDAKLKLVAGDINLVQQMQKGRPRLERAMAMDAEPQFEEKSFFEYHLYALKRPATVRDRQNKQVTFIEPADARVEKAYVYDGQRDARKVNTILNLRNDKKSGLGLPLPAGKVRIYKADDDGALLFLGEDQIAHTPTNDKLRLRIGTAFDITGERVKTEERVEGKRQRRHSFKITLSNQKAENVEVLVVEHFYGDWRMLQTSQPVSEKTARRAEWRVNVPAKKEATLTFSFEQRW